MVNINYTLTTSNNNLDISGNGDKVCNLSAGSLPVGTKGHFKVVLAPDVITNQDVYATQSIDSNTYNYNIYNEDNLSKNKEITANKLISNNNLIVNYSENISTANVSDVHVVSNILENSKLKPTSRSVTYSNNMNFNADVREVPEQGQENSYLVKALPVYDTIQKKLSVPHLTPMLDDNYTYVGRTSLFYVLLECNTFLEQNAGYIATGRLTHHIPYYSNMETIENALMSELSTNNYCENIDNKLLPANRIANKNYTAFSVLINFNIDSRFKFTNNGFTDIINIYCDIEYQKHDDFDCNGFSKISIKKIHQSFKKTIIDIPNSTNTTYAYVVNSLLDLQSSNENYTLKPHSTVNDLAIGDLVGINFVNTNKYKIESNTLNQKLYVNFIKVQKDILVFQKSNGNKLYSLESFSDFIITPRPLLNFVPYPQYPELSAFMTVYVYSINKKVTLQLGLELIGSKLNGHFIKKNFGNQERHFDFVVKPNNRLVFWDVNHVAEEQVLVSPESLGFTVATLVNNTTEYSITEKIFNTYHRTKIEVVGSPNINEWKLISEKNKNLSFHVIKSSQNKYIVQDASFIFKLDNMRNVMKFNLINTLNVDIEITDDKTFFDEEAENGYGILADNKDVCKKLNMAICMRQAFSPNLWDIRLLDFGSTKDELSLPNWDI